MTASYTTLAWLFNSALTALSMNTRLDTVESRSATATAQRLHIREEKRTALKNRIQVERDMSTVAEPIQRGIEAAQQLLSREKELGRHTPIGVMGSG